MQFQFQVAPPGPTSTGQPLAGHPPTPDVSDLLRQLLETQREQNELLRTLVAFQDGGARWRAFAARWEAELTDQGHSFKETVASLEKAYIRMISDLSEQLREDDDLDNEFTLNEFLDRYGTRLSQIGNLLNLISPLADVAPTGE